MVDLGQWKRHYRGRLENFIEILNTVDDRHKVRKASREANEILVEDAFGQCRTWTSDLSAQLQTDSQIEDRTVEPPPPYG